MRKQAAPCSASEQRSDERVIVLTTDDLRHNFEARDFTDHPLPDFRVPFEARSVDIVEVVASEGPLHEEIGKR